MKRIELLLLAATSFAVPACSQDIQTPQGDDDNTGSQGSADEWDQALNNRVVDYEAALRGAALRLTGDLPTAAEIAQVHGAADDAAKKTAYEALITNYLGRPTFATQMFEFWQNTMKMGGTPAFDSAPALATQITVNNLSYMNLFTQNANTVVTFDPATGAFTAAAPINGGPVAGILTDAGVHEQYFSNFGFRRVRFIQEVFDCARFPAEINSAGGVDVGGASLYTGVWPFQSIAGTSSGGRVNFLDTSAVICANCHQTINHIAPLVAFYDAAGMYNATTMQVPTPLPKSPLAVIGDYLPAGQQQTAWRLDKPAADLPALGAQMAADPGVAACGVARIWNWALGKTDITDTLQIVPNDTIATQLAAFTSSGFKMKDLVYAVFTSDDFVKF